MNMTAADLATWQAKWQDAKIIEYPQWTLYLERKQYYLGWVFAWAKRPDAHEVGLLTASEWSELQQIIFDTKEVFASFLRPELVNVSFLGNITRHCHCHVIPRYKWAPTFEGMSYPDDNFGNHYNQSNTQGRETLEDPVYMKLRAQLQQAYQDIRKNK